MTQGAQKGEHGDHRAHDDQPTEGLQTGRQADHQAGQQRQGLAHRVELLDHLGNDEDHQGRDDQTGDHRQHDRIDQGRGDLGPDLLLLLKQIGQTI